MLHLDYRDPHPIYAQIMDGIRRQITAGVLCPGDKLPSVREQAVQLSINPNTIQRAYRELEAEGWIVTVPGKGCFVAEASQTDPHEEVRALNTFDEAARQLLALGYTRQELIRRLQQEDTHA